MIAFPRPGSVAVLLVCCVILPAPSPAADPPADFRIETADRICLIGNALAERMQHDGWLETHVQHLFPDHRLVIRNLGFAGDELDTRLRAAGFGSPDEHLRRQGADVVFAFFGGNEAFAGEQGLEAFRAALDRFIEHTMAQRYNGESAPRLVLFSPIAHEDLGDPLLPDSRENNRRIELYTRTMSEVAQARGIRFVDLFAASQRLYAGSPAPLTINGMHLNESGNRRLAREIVSALFPSRARDLGDDDLLRQLRRAALDKNFHWFHRYRAVDGYSIYGGRSWLEFTGGVTNREVLEREMEILDQMTANRDRRIWNLAQGRDVEVPDDNLPPFLEVETNSPGDGPGGKHVYLNAEQAIERMEVAEGLRVELFASEQDFPELANPVQMAFDTRGRLWVAVAPSYPHWKPGEAMDDKVLILDDADGDGRADRCTVFADGLHVPTGLEFYGGGLLVGAQPDLLYLRDTDGDDRADVRTRVLHGFDSADTHHAINSFVLGPGGALYFQEGTFHHTQVETPWGPPRRNVNAGVYRYEPRTHRFDVYVSFGFANPHGHVFDRWGQDFITDATGNFNYYATPFSGRIDYPRKHSSYFPFFEQRVRPSAATGILSSRHFPDSMQGDYLLANVVGFRGILRYKIEDDGAGFRGVEAGPLVQSSDPNFRPVDLEMGPDGALYFLDWHNALIGHMQHHLRDPSRDRRHGRIYRLRCADRALLPPEQIHGASIPVLLNLLKSSEDRVRYRAKIELEARDSRQVLDELRRWVDDLARDDPEYEHHLLEALWLHQYHHAVNETLLHRLLRSPDGRARAAATRVLCTWRGELQEPLQTLRTLARDEHPRVRLEAVRACSFFENAEAAEVALESLRHASDRFLDYALDETLSVLEPYWKPLLQAGTPLAENHPDGLQYLLDRLATAELLALPPGVAVYRAWLSRAGIPHQRRHHALHGLAEWNRTRPAEELVAAMERLDAREAADAEEVLAELSHLLASTPRDQLQSIRPRLARLAAEGRKPMTRRLGLVGLVATDGSLDRVWDSAADQPDALRELLGAVPLVADRELRASAHGRLTVLLDRLPTSLAGKVSDAQRAELRRAAIRALASTGKRPSDVVRTIAALLAEKSLREAAIQGLGRIENRDWPPATAAHVVESIRRRVEAIPPSERTESQVLEELALASRLLPLLPAGRAATLRKALNELGVHVVILRPRPLQMQYDRARIFVEAGKPVEIRLHNVDIMPHNLVITRPGALSEVGLAAEKLAVEPEGYTQGYVPDLPAVLLATRMLQPGESDALRFVAPRETGDYPYVCTFPGHWRRMHGTMHVVENLDDVPARVLAAATDAGVTARPLVREWTVEDLAEDLARGLGDRSLKRGKRLFTELACARCHRIGDDGDGVVGPDLVGVRKKLRAGEMTLADVLREIIEPSARIDDRYRTRVIQDTDGRVHTGIVAERDGTSVRLLTNPLGGQSDQAMNLLLARIEQEQESRISLMPAGLLNTLTREEILDLLAYVVQSGGRSASDR